MTEFVTQHQFDLIWIIIASAMVMFMQAGFTALESGLTQAKNTINVAIKNITDSIAAILVFWLLGYTFVFGDSISGWIGIPKILDDSGDPSVYTYFVFQAVFAGTAATIVSGAVAEQVEQGTDAMDQLVADNQNDLNAIHQLSQQLKALFWLIKSRC